MKIAFVNQPFDGVIPPHQNSVGIWTFQVAPYLAQANQVLVYAKRMRTQNQWDAGDNIEYRFVPALPNIIVRRLSNMLARFQNKTRPVYASSLYYLDYILQVALNLRKEHCDVIHVHNFSQFVPLLRAFNPTARIAIHMHCEWLSQLDPAMIERRIQKADFILGSSDYITQKVKQRFPQLADRCYTVFNGVDADDFNADAEQPTSNEPRLLFVGRISPEKGVHVLIEAFRQVAKHHPEVKLDLVGTVQELPVDFLIGLSDEPQVAQLAALYQENYSNYLQRLIPVQLKDRVRFWGGVSHEKTREFYRKANILVNPSFSEAFGMSLIEGMANQKPVIATRVGGMPEIVRNGKTGLLVNTGDVSALADAMNQLLANSEQQRTMGRAGRERVLKLFTWEKVTKRLSSYYQLGESAND
jgi:spore coat protein SA